MTPSHDATRPIHSMSASACLGRRGGRARLCAPLLALAAAVLALVAGQPRAEAAPEAHLLRVDPRASTVDGSPVLTTVLDTWDTLSRRTNTLAVIDVSGSMDEPASGASTRLDVATLAATEAVSLSADDSGFGLWEFSTDLDGRRDHRELVPLGPLGENIGAITRRQAVEEALRDMEPTADTALYETLLAAYREAKRTFDPEGVNNVVLLTDGDQDNPGGDLSLAKLKAELSDLMDPDEPIGLIAIGYGEQADLQTLEELSDLVGGEAYGAERTSDITRIILQALTN